jgi:SAM-dependent methyltransferase
MASTRHDRRWREEAAFFGKQEYSQEPIPKATIQRYMELKKPWLPAEYAFHLLGEVQGKKILEIGCGDGTNAILLGLRGATVFGVDISSVAIEFAKKRAALHGVEDRVRFICSPLEVCARDTDETFDVIFGWAILHHLIPVLDSIMRAMRRLAHEETVFLCVEPVSLWRWFRSLRLRLPIPIKGTSGERPLETDELKVIRHFHFVLRLAGKDLLINNNYEKSGRYRRFLYDMLAHLDNFLLETIGFHGLASVAVLHGRYTYR